MTTTTPSRQGFTLVELLVVISIVALLVALLLSALGSARFAAAKVKCLAQQRHIAVAARSYVADHEGWYVPSSNQSGELSGETVGRLNPNGELGLLRWMSYAARGRFVGSDPRSDPASRCPWSIVQPGEEYEAYGFRRVEGTGTRNIVSTVHEVPNINRGYNRFDNMERLIAGDGRSVARGIAFCATYHKPSAFGYGAWTNWRLIHDGRGINATYADGSGRWISQTQGLNFNGQQVDLASTPRPPQLEGMLGISLWQNLSSTGTHFDGATQTRIQIDRNH